MHILTLMNDAMQMVRIAKGNVVREYTIAKGRPVATVWSAKDGDQVLALSAAREEIASLLGSGWSMLPSAL